MSFLFLENNLAGTVYTILLAICVFGGIIEGVFSLVISIIAMVKKLENAGSSFCISAVAVAGWLLLVFLSYIGMGI